ncbi:DUF2116 family Zn-ribbon domain-containing protein [Facklamia sp. P12950]|uniref:sigma factor-like helix-turn-helix DNA-binding protein n=1 Tax=Facklamia sp. P12950 TaxID=3421951 RepID=UPI003D1627BB
MIEKLRQEGYSYKEIADALRISINTVKSYCRRNGLTGTAEKKRYICINCGTEIGEGKRFCSSMCRQTWWNNNLDKLIVRLTTLLLVPIAINLLMPMGIKIGNIVLMNAISRIGLAMNNEFKFILPTYSS